ncbi:MAG: HEAT repeat domain-containing protein [Planctomycetaceae bacterium]
MPPAEIFDRIRSLAAKRFRIGSLVVMLALGWPLVLPLCLSLSPDYVEFEFNSLPALMWVWFPSAAALAIGLLLLIVPGLRDWRVPFWFVAMALALVVSGGLRVAYEWGVDLTLRAGLLGSRAVPGLLDVLAVETASSRVKSRTTAARDGLLMLGKGGVPRLMKALSDSDWSVRATAAGVLAQLGSEAESAEKPLIKTLSDADARVRSAAADAVLRVAPTARFNVPVLIEILNGDESVTRVDATIALGDLGPIAADAVPALTAALKDPYWALRVNAANALGNIGPKAAAAVPALTDALKDPEERVRSSAAAALDKIRAQ